MSTPRKGDKGRGAAAAEINRSAAIALIVAGKTQVEIAASINVHKDTVSAWMREPEAREAIEAAKARLVDEAHDRFVALLEKAVQTHEKLLASEDDAVRVKAVQLAYDRLPRFAQKQQVEHSGAVSAPIMIVGSDVDVQAMRQKARALEARTSEQEATDDD